MEITATIDGRVKTVTEASIRRHLKLEDSDGIPTLPNAKIFEQLALMGYASDSDKLTFQKEDAETQERTSADTEVLLEQEEPTELVEDPGSGEKGEKEISTTNISASTAGVSTTEAILSIVIPEVSTAILERQVYIRRSEEKRKDKGKAIMKDDESVQKKTKKHSEPRKLRHEVAICLKKD
ncbi:hypothetical protein Tco_0154799 [Tanacetum coccineum]